MTESLPDGVHPASLGYTPDPTRLSPNAAKKLIEPAGPRRFQYEREHGRKQKAVWDFGKVAHHLVLGEGDRFLVLYPEIHGLKKDGTVAENPAATTTWKQAVDKARAEGLTPIYCDDYKKALAMAQEVHADPDAGPLLAEGEAEQWLYSTDYESGQPLRQRLDWKTHRDRLYIVEYKTAASADPKVFERKAFDLGYHLACAFAVTAAIALGLDDSPAYLVIAQEKEPPYLLTVNEFGADEFALGYQQMQQAIAIYRECTETGMWPGYPPGINTLHFPAYAFNRNQPTMNDLLQGADQ